MPSIQPVKVIFKSLLCCILFFTPALALALDFKSVLPLKAIFYDAPSVSATKVYIVCQQYPVEVIVDLGTWLKVRDAQGSLSWVESKNLTAQRTIFVTANKTELHQQPDANSTLLASVDQQVILELVDTKPMNGWLKVKHAQGLTGYVLLNDVWGFK